MECRALPTAETGVLIHASVRDAPWLRRPRATPGSLRWVRTAPAGRPILEESFVAESKKRKKAAYVPPRNAGRDASNPVWLVPAMATCLIGGVGWIVVYYISNTTLLHLGNLNLLIGFGLLIVGAVLTSRWK